MPKKRKSKRKARNPFERYAKGPVTVSRRYLLPVSALKSIQMMTPAFGSQARALQVATEILARFQRPVSIKRQRLSPTTRMSYKLLPRTIELLNRLCDVYGDYPRTFAACVVILEKAK